MDLSNLSLDHRATVADSLADYAEGFANAAEASGGDAEVYFRTQSENVDRVLDFFLAGRDLDTADLGVVESALEASFENCVALDLAAAANGYDAAAVAIFGTR